MEILLKGSSGRNVQKWQEALIEKGYSLGEWGADGDFGGATDAATRQLQVDAGIVVDGLVGPASWAAVAQGDDLALVPERPSVSSASSLICGGVEYDVPGVDLRNWSESGVFHFTKTVRPQKLPVTKLVVHESTSRSREDTMRGWLKPRGGQSSPYWIGIHGDVEADGSAQWHNDSDDRLVHGGPHNDSVGLEVINPYYPAWNNSGKWPTLIDAPWADRGPERNKAPRYVVPRPAQLEALSLLIARLTDPDQPLEGLAIPRTWHGLLENGRFAFTRVEGVQGPGIYAHGYYAHADGWFPLLYCFLRLEGGLSPVEAYNTALKLTTGARGSVDVLGYVRAR